MKTAFTPSLAAIALVLAAGVAQAEQAKDDAMLALASKSGCMTCHQVDPGWQGTGWPRADRPGLAGRRRQVQGRQEGPRHADPHRAHRLQPL